MRTLEINRLLVKIGGREYLVNPADPRIDNLLFIATSLVSTTAVLVIDERYQKDDFGTCAHINENPDKDNEPGNLQVPDLKVDLGNGAIVQINDSRHPLVRFLLLHTTTIRADQLVICLPNTNEAAAAFGPIFFIPFNPAE
jgi:hypothetical protein